MAVGKGSMDRASKALKTTTNKTASQEKTTAPKKRTKKDAQEMKTAVITATDPQVMELVEKAQTEKAGKGKEKKEIQPACNMICGIGDELPVYFL